MGIIKIVDEHLNKVFTAITETERDYSYLDWKLLK